jgi:zinc protease
MVGLVKARFGRDQLDIAIVGDLDDQEAGALIDRAFASLPAQAAPFTVPEARPRQAGLIVVPLDVPQSTVVFGQAGLKRDDPDFYAAFVLMHVLGGSGFASRLMYEVRETRGLAYSIYSYLLPRQVGGLIVGGVGTENDRVAQTIEIVRAEWARARDQGLSDDELASAKTNINGGFALRFTSTDRIADQLLSIKSEKLGLDYIKRRADYFNAVTAEDVRRVAKRLLDPDNLTIVVVGRPKGLNG